MIGPIIAFLASTVGRYVLGGLGVLALFVAFKHSEQAKGAAKAVAKIEKANENAISAGRRAVAASNSASVRGRLDPSTRYD